MPDHATILDTMDAPDPLRESGDVETDLPLHAIDPAYFNPKNTIHGVYRRGLIGSLATFSLRDRLKVWPNPRSKGRYLALDGNQRLDVIREMIEDHLASDEAAARLAAELETEGLAFDPEAHTKRRKAAYAAVREDEAFMASARMRVADQMIPCRILADLDETQAKLITATWDRNRSKFDETKLAALSEEIIAARQAYASELEGKRDTYRKKLEAMIRPERVIIHPSTVTPTASPVPAQTPGSTPDPTPTADKPWGDPPPIPEDAPPRPDFPRSAPPEPLIPVIFDVSRANKAKLDAGILRCKSRPIREAKLMEAIARLMAVDVNANLSDAYVETLLVCLNDRIALAEATTEEQ